MMWEETWELHEEWECWYGNGREWELGTHSRISRTPLVDDYALLARRRSSLHAPAVLPLATVPSRQLASV